LFKVYAGGIRR